MSDSAATDQVYSCPRCESGEWRPYMLCRDCDYYEGTPP